MPPKPTHDESQQLFRFLSGHAGNAAERDKAVDAVRWAFEVEEPEVARRLLEWMREDRPGAAPAGPAPPEYRTALLRLLHRAARDPRLGLDAANLARLETALARQDTPSLRSHLGPALRLVIGKPRDGDIRELQAWLTQILKETSMAITYEIDTTVTTNLQDPAAKNSYIEAIKTDLQKRFHLSPEDADVGKSPGAAVVMGMVLKDGESDPASNGLKDATTRAWLESMKEMDAINDAGARVKVPLSEVYPKIAAYIAKFTASESISVQQFASVSREVIASGSSIPFGHPNFEAAIRIALDKNVAAQSTGDSLSLPPGSVPGGTTSVGGDSDLVPENIRVTGLAYSLALLEKTLLIPVTDRVSVLFMNGMLQTTQEAAGTALDQYYWDSEDRLTESQRRSHYSRMLGMPGGEVSKEVAPNKDFEQTFLRFISSVSEFARQREVNRMFTSATSAMSTSGEQVRKCAYELTKNASLYAWGSGFYITTRIRGQLQRAIEILNQPAILKAFAASNHWQVVERVAQQDFGGAPNWSKYSTMADAAFKIFELLSRYTTAITTPTPGRPFLFDVSQPGTRSDVDQADTERLLTSVQGWLAVNGVRDEQVKQYSQPVELTSAPSVPSVAGTGPGSATEVINKLKQLTAGGTPNPDQLQQLLATLH